MPLVWPTSGRSLLACRSNSAQQSAHRGLSVTVGACFGLAIVTLADTPGPPFQPRGPSFLTFLLRLTPVSAESPINDDALHDSAG